MTDESGPDNVWKVLKPQKFLPAVSGKVFVKPVCMMRICARIKIQTKCLRQGSLNLKLSLHLTRCLRTLHAARAAASATQLFSHSVAARAQRALVRVTRGACAMRRARCTFILIIYWPAHAHFRRNASCRLITYRQRERFARAAPAPRAKRFDSKNRGRASPVKNARHPSPSSRAKQ